MKTIYHFLLVMLFLCTSFQLQAQDVQQVTFTLSPYGIQDLQVAATQDKNFTINWGDGKTQVVTGKGSTYIEFNHTYSTSTLFNVTITGNTADCDLTYLSLPLNSLTQLDVSMATKLEILYCSAGQLATLNVSKNTSLKTLNCGGNKLTTLDITKNTALERLDCSHNKLSTLDVSQNAKMNTLFCTENNLTDIKVSPLTLINLYTKNNFLPMQTLYNLTLAYGSSNNGVCFGAQHPCTTYNIPIAAVIDFNPYLLTSGINQFSITLNGTQARKDTDYVSDSGKLTFLSKGKYEISVTNDLIVNNNYDSPELIFYAMVDPIPEMITLNSNVTDVYASALLHQISVAATPNTSVTIDWGDHTANTYTTPENGSVVSYNKPYSGTGSYQVKVTSTGGITEFYCVGIKTTSMDLSNCPSLKKLYCSNNLFTSIDLSACNGLQEFRCSNSLLTSLDVIKNTSLKILDCMFSKLTTVELSKNNNLQTVFFRNNAIPLDKLYSISNLIKNATGKDLGTQTLPALTVAGNTEIDLTNKAMLENQATAFIVQKGGKTAVENTDYTLVNGKLIFLGDGTFTVTMSNSAIISTSAAKVVATYTVIGTGTNDLSGKSFNVYPNPTRGMVYVKSESETLPRVRIMDLNGRVLIQQQTNRIDLSPYENGIYLMQVDGKTVKVSKY